MEQTNFDAFISYSSKNKQLADAMCHALEQHKIKCWIAPRNVQPGNPYAREIISGLESSKIMVLVFTRDADESEHVANELEMAFNYQKVIIPFVAEDVPMNKEFSYYLKRKHWLTAYPNPEESFAELVKVVSDALGISDNTPMTTTTVSESSSQPVKTEAVVHVHSDMDCRIEQFGKSLGVATAGEYFPIHLRKGNHVLKFISTRDECVRLTKTYMVEDVEMEDFFEVALKPLWEKLAGEYGKYDGEFVDGVYHVFINEKNFPDDNFRNFLLEQDYGKNAFLTDEVIKRITTLDLSEKEIKDLKGIELFTELTNLKCGVNQLTSLDVSHNTKLTVLNCSSNQLTSLDVSQNTKLIELYCWENQLTSLDVSHNTELTWLSCSSNQLNSLDVSHNTKLNRLYCGSNQLTSLDISHNAKLTKLGCSENQLTSLDVSRNTELTWLNCSENQLTSLDVSHNTELTELYCWENQLTSLDVSHNTELIWLNCSKNQLASLDVSQNTKLNWLYCDSNQLTSLDVSNNPRLKEVDCENNPSLKVKRFYHR